MTDLSALVCPVPLPATDRVQLAHGGGGRLMHELLRTVIQPALGLDPDGLHLDAAVLPAPPPGARLALTTDTYVVHPLQFPGGDIGSLAVHGTVNDLACVGARPAWMSVGLVIEEGLPVATLRSLLTSMGRAAEAAGIVIVTGDTKVVERGKADGLFINTAGVGFVDAGVALSPAAMEPGDRLVINGDLGRHGIAIMAAREHLAFDTTLTSDSAPLAELVLALLEAGVRLRCVRDLTRGGLATVLVELAEQSRRSLLLHEPAVPLDPQVAGACAILGLDPLYVANEGRLVAVVAAEDADAAVAVMRRFEVGAGACVVGEVRLEGTVGVGVRGALGAVRRVERLSGEQLPRIC